MTSPTFAAVDIGASSGRVMAGTVDGDRVSLRSIHRFPNGVTARDGHLRWDVVGLFRQILTGLAQVPDARSIGIDTWGVDYGLLDDQGGLLADPIAYRDDRTTAAIESVHGLVPPDELYAINGLQVLPISTVYQLAAEQRGPLLARAAHAVLLPDLLAYWLTGVLRSELTNASTTGLLDVHTRAWSVDLLARLDLPADLLPALQAPGEPRGHTPAGVLVTTVGSHDTASAVVAVPASHDRFAYISSGTWSLVGLELPAPVVSDEARAANFTNETGVDGRTRFLRNVSGLWLLQECLRSWGRDGEAELDALLDEAARLPTDGPRVDADDPAFIPPGDMPDRIAAAADVRSMTEAEMTRCILDSLADAYARAVHQAAIVAGGTVDVIHIVGGGARNTLLCQLTADAAGLPVIAGPVEATAMGNVLVQARAVGAAPTSLEGMRALVAASTELRRFDPS
jgi:rhamnulokinase